MENMSIIKSILKKLKFHPIFFFLAFISVLTGLFKEFLVFFLIIFFHEMGHVLAALHFKWNIKSINFYPFGGLIKFDDYINRPIREEFLIVMSGIGAQIIFYFFICILHNFYYINDSLFIMFRNNHYSIILFNLIPVYPLDGIKIANLFLNKFLPFKISHTITLFLSYIFFIIFLLFSLYNNLSMNTLLIISLILSKIIEEQKNHNYYFNRFIFERFLYNFNFKKVKVINNGKINKMYRDKKHVFKINKNYISEKTVLKNRFTHK